VGWSRSLLTAVQYNSERASGLSRQVEPDSEQERYGHAILERGRFHRQKGYGGGQRAHGQHAGSAATRA